MADQPDVERGISTHSLQSGANILHRTSAVLTAGAGGLHHNSQNAGRERADSNNQPGLLRQQSSSRMRETPEADVVQERVVEDFREYLEQNLKWLVLTFIIIIVSTVAMIWVFCAACVAEILHYDDKPCDQPLRYYFPVSVVWSHIPQRIEQILVLQGWSLGPRLCASCISTMISWLIFAWGLFMVGNAKTCPKTNPGLFFPIRTYIYVQIYFSIFLLICMVVFIVGFRRFLLLAMRLLAVENGCASAVHNLPKVEAGDPDLKDDAGEVLGCPICMEPLAEAVRTPCNHFFHEECLATWCARHVDCPLCRQQIGEPDRGDGPVDPISLLELAESATDRRATDDEETGQLPP